MSAVINPTLPLSGLAQLIRHRIQHHFDQPDIPSSYPTPELLNTPSYFAKTLPGFNLSEFESLLLLIALVPHLRPNFYDEILKEALSQAGDFPQVGGTRGKHFRGFLPTGETALFIMGGDDVRRRFEVQQLFGEDHFFATKHILWLEEVPEGEPRMSGRIILAQEYVDLLTTGQVASPRFSMHFPAQLISTQLSWEDLVLHESTLEQIKELLIWVRHGARLMIDWNMQRKLKPGYRALFHGPPGTGKTLTATLLGKYTNKRVYKIDLSMVVSKYIGETEKNLSNLFSRAENKDWILFFDEADALFGKRTNVRDAHDKYANQEVSYLLQRVEGYNGLVVLASNFKSNLDEAFTRRFQSIIHFPFPGPAERLRLWKNAFPDQVQLDKRIKLKTLAHQYELSGADIMNAVQYACLNALERSEATVQLSDLERGVVREFQKTGKVVR